MRKKTTTTATTTKSMSSIFFSRIMNENFHKTKIVIDDHSEIKVEK